MVACSSWMSTMTAAEGNGVSSSYLIVRAGERLLPEGEVVDPDLPELAGAVVHVAVRDRVDVLVDVEDALRVGVLRELRHALDDVDLALLPLVVEREVGGARRPTSPGSASVWKAPSTFFSPRNFQSIQAICAGVAAVAVLVGVLAEERVRALRRRETADAAERRQVEPAVVLLRRVDVAVVGEADALQIERLDQRVQGLLVLVALAVRDLGLRIDVEPADVAQAAEVIDQEVALDLQRPLGRDRTGVGVEVPEVEVVEARARMLKFYMIFIATMRILGVDDRERPTGDVVLELEAVGARASPATSTSRSLR